MSIKYCTSLLFVLGIAEFFVPACMLSSAAWSICKIWNSRYCRAIQRMALMQTLHNAVLPTPVGRFPQYPGLIPIPRALRWLSTLSRVLNSAVLGPNAPCVHYPTGTAPIFASQKSVEWTSDVCCSPTNSNSQYYQPWGFGHEVFGIWTGLGFNGRFACFECYHTSIPRSA